jgi:PAS domain S-box-containing protein
MRQDITRRKHAEEALRESEARLAKELEDTKQLHEISRQLIQEENVNALYQQILDAAVALMRSDMGSMQLLDPERRQLRLIAWKGFHPESAAFWETVTSESSSSCGSALLTGERQIVSDVAAPDSGVNGEDLKHYQLSGIVSVQTTPLISRKGHLVGMISTHWRQRHVPDEHELSRLDVVARQAADALERARGEKALRESQARLQLALDVADMGTFVWHLQEDRVDLDARMLALFGLRANTGLIQLTGALIRLIHPDDRAGHARAFAHATDVTGDGVMREEIRVVQADGSERWLAVIGHTFFEGDPRRAIWISGVATDITARKQIECERAQQAVALEERVRERTAELEYSRAQLQSLSARLERLREEERDRMAREIHDELGQELTGLKIELAQMRKGVSDHGLLHKLDILSTNVDTAIHTVRRLATELRPGILDDFGLPAAIEWHLNDFGQRAGLIYRFMCEAENIELDRDTAAAIFRIFQETLTNIARHANATHVDVQLHEVDGHFILEVQDNGRGISKQQLTGSNSLGLLGMRERVRHLSGKLVIEGVPDRGTTVLVRIPLKSPS